MTYQNKNHGWFPASEENSNEIADQFENYAINPNNCFITTFAQQNNISEESIYELANSGIDKYICNAFFLGLELINQRRQKRIQSLSLTNFKFKPFYGPKIEPLAVMNFNMFDTNLLSNLTKVVSIR